MALCGSFFEWNETMDEKVQGVVVARLLPLHTFRILKLGICEIFFVSSLRTNFPSPLFPLPTHTHTQNWDYTVADKR